MQLNDIIEKIKVFRILDQEQILLIDVLLAVALSLEFDNPFWIMIIGRASSGKTTLSEILKKTKKTHFIRELTDKALFSGNPLAGGGYMIREVKKKGLLIFPDFTTIISNDSRTKKKIFNQLRTIYDGSSSRLTGMDTGKMLEWNGKVAIIALVTDSINDDIERSSDLGERFLFLRFNPKEIPSLELSEFRKRLNERGDAKELINEVQNMVAEFIETKKNKIRKS